MLTKRQSLLADTARLLKFVPLVIFIFTSSRSYKNLQDFSLS